MLPAKNYSTLHGIRGVAALCIVVLHSPRLFGTAPAFLGMAVDLFFALSGFVLAHAYEDRLRRGMTPLEFLRRRWARLYPLYGLGLLLGIVHAVVCIQYGSPTEPWSWARLFTVLPFSLLMLPAPVTQVLFPLNGPMWSIFFELLANLLWVAFWRPLQSLRALVVTVLVCGVLYSCAVYYWETPAVGLTWETFPGGLARVCCSFAAGLLIHRLRDRLRAPSVPPLLLMVSLPVMALTSPGPIAQLVSVVLVFPVIVLMGARSEPWSATRGFYDRLGKASYCVYVLHRPLAALVYGAALQFAGLRMEAFAPWGGVVFLGGLVVGGLLLTDRFETPARWWLTRNLPRAEKQPRSVPSRDGLLLATEGTGEQTAAVSSPRRPESSHDLEGA
ncbi:acyltransferase [Streptomyces sp. NPDC019396]|uniref:acyltransferase family protein n=1 Tax=Streptomyces sp. NPDC019396 TaxID=3154687 RepID=UPI0033EC9971